ncbi:homoserine O-succinyltransferase MetA [Solemya velum gill symbiont]|uniref:homoserine O-succinyltransferase MetA n=1 Tax=Solemya velum gill symbiont TaxID=2340 RepID=UPI000996A666|nr:homoserine O-succinyltransferase [Solemya velum gill symbiont]OOY53951.1 homoserine O-succinyltransferase [Solemya velum gill symbiont]OOY62943.1 homoserine O-succinyltransferase [Solemya velum gill symbiont]OOY66086.1 homoserine O-succinyltransferase [Solemya velum gill symbiont]OOY69019.1 homoserine O-succinyltransferase [Solemya velum gill symbiont]OOY72045.1 homoserine O-succinyltransferase [Solemya velum gill symbiont]
MPLVAHSKLPTFDRMKHEGHDVLEEERASHQDIRELHIGLLNMMPDAALSATERQFFRLVGSANLIAQFHMHVFTLDELPRSEQAREYIDNYYETFDDIKRDGLDALIITGANVTHPNLSSEPFWEPLADVMAWAHENVTSVLCSCLATHALLEHHYGIKRNPMEFKRWGIFDHKVSMPEHPLVENINTRFDVPHSRFNQVTRQQLEEKGVVVLAEGEEAGVHLAVSPDLFRTVFFQGHPEYDSNSLLKEYKREVLLWFDDQRDGHPPFPDNYLTPQAKAILGEYRSELIASRETGIEPPEFPEKLLMTLIDNTWRDTAKAVVSNWLGHVYQITNSRRELPFMDGIDPQDPLGLKS